MAMYCTIDDLRTLEGVGVRRAYRTVSETIEGKEIPVIVKVVMYPSIL